MSGPDAIRARLLSLKARHPSRTRAEARRRAAGYYAAAIVVALGVFQASGGITHSHGRPLAFTLGIAAGAAAMAVVATIVALGRGPARIGRPRQLLAGLALAIPFVTLAWLVAWNGHYVEPFARVGYRCLALTVGLGAVLLGAAVMVRRDTIATTPTASGAALGAAMGAWAGVAVDLWCPLTNASHALVGHFAPLVLLVTMGAVLGHRVLRLRPILVS